jgi:hypothetical protein
VTLFITLAEALALTLLVELPVAAALGLRSRRALAAVLCVNLVTNPALNLLLASTEQTSFGGLPRLLIGVVEVAVVLIEWRLLLWALGGKSGTMLRTSAVMNAASWAAGVVVFSLLAQQAQPALPFRNTFALVAIIEQTWAGIAGAGVTVMVLSALHGAGVLRRMAGESSEGHVQLDAPPAAGGAA